MVYSWTSWPGVQEAELFLPVAEAEAEDEAESVTATPAFLQMEVKAFCAESRLSPHMSFSLSPISLDFLQIALTSAGFWLVLGTLLAAIVYSLANVRRT